jgi:hypothetical protein
VPEAVFKPCTCGAPAYTVVTDALQVNSFNGNDWHLASRCNSKAATHQDSWKLHSQHRCCCPTLAVTRASWHPPALRPGPSPRCSTAAAAHPPQLPCALPQLPARFPRGSAYLQLGEMSAVLATAPDSFQECGAVQDCGYSGRVEDMCLCARTGSSCCEYTAWLLVVYTGEATRVIFTGKHVRVHVQMLMRALTSEGSSSSSSKGCRHALEDTGRFMLVPVNTATCNIHTLVRHHQNPCYPTCPMCSWHACAVPLLARNAGSFCP